MESIFGPDGFLAKHHSNFEYRAGQLKMAKAIYDVLQKGGSLCIEAGTGTGKTLAYLVPALLLNKRVIISTATKNLQEQLYQKDIPFLEKALNRTLKVAYLKGRANYVCLHRIKQSESTVTFSEMEDVTYFAKVKKWATNTATGDKAELVDLPEYLSFWRDIDARSEICLGHKCNEYEQCFITTSRQQANDADIVIVNHHLFFADLAARDNDYGAVLPDYQAVIFDEAHEIEDIAAEYFGTQVSSYRIQELIQDVQKALILQESLITSVIHSCAQITQSAEHFWMSFSNHNLNNRFALGPNYFARRDSEGKVEMTTAGHTYLQIDNALGTLEEVLKKVNKPPAEMEKLLQRLELLRFDLEFITAGENTSFVYWFERRGRGCFLQATPIDVSHILHDRLFSQMEATVLTSATLTSNGKFDFICSRLGVDLGTNQCEKILIDSQFNYKEQTILYLPRDIPDPRTSQFTIAAVDKINELIEITKGRTFVLSTSVSHMQELYERVSAKIDFPCFVQGYGSRTGILEKFKKTPGAVLFATSSFWQGVDVQGEALSCVIIDKLPFPVPTDPVVVARGCYLEEQGMNPFTEYSLPQAIIALKQGLGRLIRSSQDRGILVVLDPRLRTKSYGKFFLNSLPSTSTTSDLNKVKEFFSS